MGCKDAENGEKKPKCAYSKSRNMATMKFCGKAMNKEYAILARGKMQQKIRFSAQKGRGIDALSKNRDASGGQKGRLKNGDFPQKEK